ncbi:hypothetical protein H2203_008789 [Taxawa tesnikishii (nom. ined.)]|nr:hypothetical protein H2203_008789 [Dothideales sp. JES 119]
MSRSFLGIQIDAVYHTSLVFGGVEYFFGAGVQTCYPGSTHHGAPMEIIKMGSTQLPLDVILEYLESLKEVYTPESYDLFAHNCNNFTNDFSMFLVGKGIPDHITSLPQTVLNTPFGQMLKPQIDASMRSITQAPVPPRNVPPASRTAASRRAVEDAVAASARRSPPLTTNGATAGTPAPARSSQPAKTHGEVYNITSSSAVDDLLASAKSTCAVIFFTSSTCAPCKIAYQPYDSLAAENPKVPFIKIDINNADELAFKYKIRATPTFMTFLHGKKENEWSGANPAQLRGNVEMLIRQAFPSHPHASLRVPSLQFGSLTPVSFSKVPPLDKLTAKMGRAGGDPAVSALKAFLAARSGEGEREATLPDLPAIAKFMRQAPSTLDTGVLFTAYDLLRCALIDPRVSGWFAEENPATQSSPTLAFLLQHVVDMEAAPYNLRLVAIQLACNLFSSSLSTKSVLADGSPVPALLVQLVTSSLIDTDHSAVRAAASSLAFNLAAAGYRIRREEEREAILESAQVELAAALLEVLSSESESAKGKESPLVKPALLAFGYLVYFAPQDGEIFDLCRAMEAKQTVMALKGAGVDEWVKDIGEQVLGKGMAV